MITRVGVISDTHGLLRPEVANCLAGVSHIVHAGDIGSPEVLEGLRRIAPVTAIRGNADVGDWARHYPETETVRVGGHGLYLLHDLKALGIDPAVCGMDTVISGHSHRVQISTMNGILFLNPGSAGPRRFKLPITLATLELDEGGLPRPVIHVIPS